MSAATPLGTATVIAAPITPTIRAATRKSLFWIAAVLFVIVIAVVGLAATGASSGGIAFSATNAAPAGSRAIAEVLGHQGVDVRVPATYTAARSALRAAASTLFLYDPDSQLDDARLRSLAGLAAHVVILRPNFSQLKALAPGVSAAGTVTKKSLSADCDLPAARNAHSISGAGSGYRIIDAQAQATGCFGSGKKTFSLIQFRASSHTVSVLGTTDAFSNEHVAERGNAALALTLLGDNDRLVWYLPSVDDSSATGTRSIGNLTPAWVGSVSVLLILAAISAAFWRGRRLGPLVIENLPVVVRASETMEGRARLYQRGTARLHALDSVRIGSADRLASLCGLPRLSSVDEVIGAVARATGRDPAGIRSLLLEAQPATDRDLVRLSDALLDLERTVARDIRPQ